MPSYTDPRTVQANLFEQAWSPWRKGMQANTDAARAGAANARQDEQLEQQRLLNRQNLTEGRRYAEQQLQKQRTYSQGETDKRRLQSARDLFVGAGGDLKTLGPNPDFNEFNSAIFKLKNQNRTRGVLESNLSKYGVFLSPKELAAIPLNQYADTLQKAKEGFDLRNLQAKARNLDVTHLGKDLQAEALRDAQAKQRTAAARSQQELQTAQQELERTQGHAPYSPRNLDMNVRVPATQEAVDKWATAVERAPAALEQAKARAMSAQAEAAQDLAAAQQSVPKDLGFHELSEAIKTKEWDIGQDREAQIQASQKRKDNRDAKIAEKVKIDALYAEGKLEAARPELEKSFAYHRNVIATIREKMAADITKVLEGDDIDPVEYARHSNAAILKVLGEAGVADDEAADLLKKLTSKAIDEIKLLEQLSVDKPALFARIQDEIYNTTGQTKEKFEALLDFVGKKGYSDDIKLTQQFLSKLQTEYPMFRETRPDNPLVVPGAGAGDQPGGGQPGDDLLPLLPETNDSNALYNSLINEIKLTEEEAKELADYSQYLPSGANTLASAPVTQEVLREYKKYRDKDVAAQLDNISGALFGTFGGGWFGVNALGGLPKHIYPNEIIAEFDEIAKKKISKNATWKDLKVAHIPDEYEVPVGDTSKGHSTYTQTSDEMSVADKEELLKNLRWYEEAVRIDKLLKKAAKEKGWDIGPTAARPRPNITPIGT